ncbi:MAG TPA: hypothetical protein VNZ26_33520 [Vicinamibacterales bacterium]|jgi:hypothetical protein|nr:hypothetical protein [Vicinamibacterales bacterium]
MFRLFCAVALRTSNMRAGTNNAYLAGSVGNPRLAFVTQGSGVLLHHANVSQIANRLRASGAFSSPPRA